VKPINVYTRFLTLGSADEGKSDEDIAIVREALE